MIKKLLILCALLGAYVSAYAQPGGGGCQTINICGCGIPPEVCMGGGSGGGGGGGGSYYRAPDKWGVIMRARGTTHFFQSYNYNDQDEAIRSATRNCEKEYGKGQCERSLIVVNQCFAIARNSRYYSTNYGSSEKQARDRALRSCEHAGGGGKCEIIAAECSK